MYVLTAATFFESHTFLKLSYQGFKFFLLQLLNFILNAYAWIFFFIFFLPRFVIFLLCFVLWSFIFVILVVSVFYYLFIITNTPHCDLYRLIERLMMHFLL